MAETCGASIVIKERMKCEEEEEEEEEGDDFISELSDCLIQHILSFLPSTKDAIRTGILSKRWLNQWTVVPILIFKNPETGTSIENFSNFIDKALNLYNCSKINKFIISSYDFYLGPLHSKLASWIHFAVTRDVKELILECEEHAYYYGDDHEGFHLPPFLLKNAASLVKLKTHEYIINPKQGEVNWASLKALHIGFCDLSDGGIQNVLSACPVIECLELCNCDGFRGLVIASKSLKTFHMIQSRVYSGSIEISCPNMEKLELFGTEMCCKSLKFKDLPASVCATLNFENDGGFNFTEVKEFLFQVQHVQELTLGPWFSMFLTFAAAVERESTLLLNNKCLTIIDPFSGVRQPELPISHLRFSSLEILVIQLHSEENFSQMESLMARRKKLSGFDLSVFDSLVSRLKTVKIVGYHYISSKGRHYNMLEFVMFLLKNARMLEDMVFLEASRQGMTYACEVCKKLSSIDKASPYAVVKAECLRNSVSDWDKIE